MSADCVEVAIIGAGTAGCLMANLLQEIAVSCVLIEKSRGLGGRCSRRIVSVSAASFQSDLTSHASSSSSALDIAVEPVLMQNNQGERKLSMNMGAASFSTEKIKYPELKVRIAAWLEAGVLSTWQYQSRCFDQSDYETHHALTALPSLNSWHKSMAAGVDVITGCRVSRMEDVAGVWYLFDEDNELIIMANRVIITSPAEQILDLLIASDLLHKSLCFQAIEAIAKTSQGQYVCAIEIEEAVQASVDMYQGGQAVLAKAIRLSNTPSMNSNMPSESTIWMLQSDSLWAQEQAGMTHEEAAKVLAQAFCQHFNLQSQARILTSHYWRLARHVVRTEAMKNTYLDSDLIKPYILDTELNLGICGDWLDTGEVAGALNSAFALFQGLKPSLNY